MEDKTSSFILVVRDLNGQVNSEKRWPNYYCLTNKQALMVKMGEEAKNSQTEPEFGGNISF